MSRPYKNFCPHCLNEGKWPWACTRTRCPIHDMYNEARQRRTIQRRRPK